MVMSFAEFADKVVDNIGPGAKVHGSVAVRIIEETLPGGCLTMVLGDRGDGTIIVGVEFHRLPVPQGVRVNRPLHPAGPVRHVTPHAVCARQVVDMWWEASGVASVPSA